ncbi:P-loop containing nucleoside triphosphate hydrolase protein [Cladochytrium replicatum]|nr:P-loop containing nucleoside triphosphate hydrolase protein [Cladochytrium replicatum]
MDLLKVVLLGGPGVGKTALRNQFVRKKFSSNYRATIGSDFERFEVDVDGRKVALQIWDTAGQERFRSLGVAFYRGADACILVYDVTNLSSFDQLKDLMNDFLKHANVPNPESFPFILVGNKTDLDDLASDGVDAHARAIAVQGDPFAPGAPIPFFETSAKQGSCVEDVFVFVARHVRAPAPVDFLVSIGITPDSSPSSAFL